MKPSKYLFCVLACFISMCSVSAFRSKAVVGDQPVYVIDGVVVKAGKVKIDGRAITYSIGQTVHKAVIKHIEMLKDADATAIYGANGAFVITTKKRQI
jgi:hypothetical protein